MCLCIFHYFSYYLPDFVIAICLRCIFCFSFLCICFNPIWCHNKPLVEPPFPAKDQALSFWSGTADSKTLDYQRTPNPRECQTELPQRQPLAYKTQHHPTASSILCRTPHPNNKQNKNTNPIICRRITTWLSPDRQRKKKNHLFLPEHKHKTHPTWSLHKPLDQTYEGRNQKKKRIQPWSLEKGDLKHNKLKKNNSEKAEKYYTNERTN